MRRVKLATSMLTALMLFAMPFSTASADEGAEGSVNVPAPREMPAEEPVAAVPPPYLSWESTSVALGVGVSWGEGMLSFEGVNHAFSVRGISLLDIGASVADGLGEVYHLENLADFEGTYLAVEAAGAVGSGRSETRMRNEHGVEISLSSELQGVELALATRGVSIRFE